VPIGSLYRHVAVLTRAGVLAVLSERRVRGAFERTYMLRVTAAQLGPADAAAMSPEDHRQAFTAFVAGLLGDFDRYLGGAKPDLARDGVGYRMGALWLDDTELATWSPYSSLASPTRRPRTGDAGLSQGSSSPHPILLCATTVPADGASNRARVVRARHGASPSGRTAHPGRASTSGTARGRYLPARPRSEGRPAEARRVACSAGGVQARRAWVHPFPATRPWS
jgi:hypothetical protein